MSADLLERHRQAFGARLRAARKNARLTQEELAGRLAAVGIVGKDGAPLSQPTIGSWERGLRYPENELTFAALASILGVFPSVLLGYPEAPRSEAEARILEQYRQADERGKRQIELIAETEAHYLDRN